MGDGSNVGKGFTPAGRVFWTRVPAEIQDFLENKKLTTKVIEAADKDSIKFLGSNRDSVEISRTKATIASVLHENIIDPKVQDKEPYERMFRLVCQDMVHDMHAEQEAVRGKERI